MIPALPECHIHELLTESCLLPLWAVVRGIEALSVFLGAAAEPTRNPSLCWPGYRDPRSRRS